jgi:hypothetical protein
MAAALHIKSNHPAAFWKGAKHIPHFSEALGVQGTGPPKWDYELGIEANPKHLDGLPA